MYLFYSHEQGVSKEMRIKQFDQIIYVENKKEMRFGEDTGSSFG